MRKTIQPYDGVTFVISLLFIISPSSAGDWSISFWGGSPFYMAPAPPVMPVYPRHGSDYDYYEYEGYPERPLGSDYYPVYTPMNPVMNRQYSEQEGYAPDGTYHREGVVEDRHSSYYSPGRNEAITRPQTTVENWNYAPGMNMNRERTTWIGADGRPHSTTVDRDTYTDPYGNTQTDTHVGLKRAPQGQTVPQREPQPPGWHQGWKQGWQPGTHPYQPSMVNPNPNLPPRAPQHNQPARAVNPNEPIRLMPRKPQPVAPAPIPTAPSASGAPSGPTTNLENPPSAMGEASRAQ
jgi:hypothetical protein